ncbi:MAG: response regulator [Trichlorobacter sp.]|uniref:response regulator n=1 Tax=Trichlorobacter sp. TaxID=2911007 RepID=UPI002567E0FD|nr:response regulator [Trichlorobacter sp.]
MSSEHKKEYTVLVVDDVPDNIDILKGVLCTDFVVKVATSGEKALAIAESALPDLILLDIMMPGMDGYEVCSRLKQIEATRDIPVVFVTALTEAVDEEKGFEVGCVDYLTKPVSPSVALARAKTHIALRQARQELQEWNSNLKGRVKGLSSLVTEKVQELASAGTADRRSREEWLDLLVRLLDMQDSDLPGHASRVAEMSVSVAKLAGCSAAEVETIRFAALLHDIGKAGLPVEAVAPLPDKLSDALKKIYLTHPVRGQLLISNIDWLQEAGVLIRHHHEQVNGSGVPDRLIGDEIPLGSRILAIADYIDRYTSHGTSGTMLHNVLKSLRNLAGRTFDKNLIAYFDDVAPVVLDKPELDKELSEIIQIDALKPGMILGEDIRTMSNIVLAERGDEVSPGLLRQLRRAGDIDSVSTTKILVQLHRREHTEEL